MPGYLREKLKIEIVRTIVYFAIVLAVYLLGYSQTHSNKNYLTVVAVVGCLPACKALVGVITRIPHKSIDPERAKEIAERASNLTVIYDLVVTSTEKIMPIECIVISGEVIFGYVSSPKVDLKETASYIRRMLNQNELEVSTIKLFNQYKPFLLRVDGLESIAAVEQADTSEYEQKLAALILNLSL